MGVQVSVPTTHRLADVGRGLAALAGVGLVVVGVPLALATWVGWPLPAAVPAPSEIADALRDTYIPDELLVKALAVVCWLVWIELVASLLVEAVAFVRGRKAGRVPLAGGLQRGAARLVAGVALLGAVFATRGVPEPASLAGQPYPPLVRPAVTITLTEAPVPPPGFDDLAATTPEEEAPTYLVQRRDTLWDIAERHLGDPFRWQEIFLINEGCPQADGGCLTDPDLIHPGWELRLPGDAVGLAPPPAPEPPAAPAAPADPAPESPSLAIEGGMVLIDDGRDAAGGGEAVLVSEGDGAATSHTFDGMVLLPSPEAGAEPVVAAPDHEGDEGEEGDEVASHAGPGPGRPSTGRDE
jgi:nucleoid-associated protein YgaU